MNFCIKYPDKINGIARPREYENSKNIPLIILSEVEASTKIDPKIGPMHGVQPKANAIPIKIELKIFLLFSE